MVIFGLVEDQRMCKMDENLIEDLMAVCNWKASAKKNSFPKLTRTKA